MGSAADLNYSKKLEILAEKTGYWVAKNDAILVFGAEKDYDSLSTAACRGAKKVGGLTVGITYGKDKGILEKDADVIVATGLERGGGREFPLVLSCDAVIAIGGGSGTLTEIAIAYQANIPVVALRMTGGWSEKLGNKYLDARNRFKIEVAKTPKEAVEKAISLARKEDSATKDILFLAGTHGDEWVGVKVLQELNQEMPDKKISWVLANEKAIKLRKRFIDVDLNRVAPGDPKARAYESRRAEELLKIAKGYRYVIDIHANKANTGLFTIVTNPKPENLFLAAALPIENIVIWTAKESAATGPLTQFVKRGVEIECGPKGSEVMKGQLYTAISNIIEKGIVTDSRDFSTKKWFKVFGKVSKGELNKQTIKRLRDFKEVTTNKESFFPLLVGVYENAVCYKMKEINFFNEFAY